MEPMLFESKTQFQTLTLLERCSNMKHIKQIHAYMVKTRQIQDTIQASKLLTFCTKFCKRGAERENFAYAHQVFDETESPNTFMWNTLIRIHSEHQNPDEAFFVYSQMLHASVEHNVYTFPFLLKAFADNSSFIEETRQIHARVNKMGYGSEVYTANSLLNVYAKCGILTSARCVFDRIMDKDTVSWNSMMNGYVKNGNIGIACELFQDMPVKNVVSWTSVIAGCVEASMFKEALEFFHEMQIAGVRPDNVAMSSALTACANLGALNQGRWIHAFIDKNKMKIDSILGCVLVDMYAKCGDFVEAQRVFKTLENKTVPIWTAMITGFAIHGRGKEALELFTAMETWGLKPNVITFTGVLTACSYSGFVDEGKVVFKNMKKVYNIAPSIEHYGCMVDLLGRAGKLEEAKKLIETMPMSPNAVILGALLRACYVHQDYNLGKKIGKILVNMEPTHSGRYIHLASIFAANGQWDQAVEVRRFMKKRGVSKLPGCSLIELKGSIHEFLAGDRSHREIDRIYQMWNQILERLRHVGYVPSTGKLLLDLEEEEKETVIHQHSEKLAIAFGLINTQPGEKIQIIKNLRVCEDCHTATKLISKVYEREIIVRDSARFHCFKDGNCSCSDYW